MKRHPALVPLSWDHHHALVLAFRIQREVPDATDDSLARIYGDLLSFWSRGLLPHFRAESECLLARLINHIPPEDARVRRLHDDHLGMANLIVRMRDAEDLETRRAVIADFGLVLRDHVRWEESELFAATEEALAGDEMERLAVELKQALPDAVVPAPGSPRGPER